MKLKVLTVGLLSLLLNVSCGNKQGGTLKEIPPQHYPTLVLEEQTAEVHKKYPALVKGREDIEIRPRIDGFIEEIYVDEGSIVRKGDRLFKINSPMAEQNLLTAQASVASADAMLNNAALNVKKTRPLVEEGIVSEFQLETVLNAYETAKASKKQAEAALSNAQATKGWTTVTSPVDGIVGAIPFRLGSLVNSAVALTTVSNTKEVFVYFSLSEKDLMNFLRTTPGKNQSEKIKNSAPVILHLSNGVEYSHKGKIETITGMIDPQTGSVNFRAVFPNPDGILRSGYTGNISIPVVMDKVFVIPQKSTFSLLNKILVYKVQQDTVIQIPIDVIPIHGGQEYVVTGGLSTKERIVTDGIITLKQGKKIVVN